MRLAAAAREHERWLRLRPGETFLKKGSSVGQPPLWLLLCKSFTSPSGGDTPDPFPKTFTRFAIKSGSFCGSAKQYSYNNKKQYKPYAHFQCARSYYRFEFYPVLIQLCFPMKAVLTERLRCGCRNCPKQYQEQWKQTDSRRRSLPAEVCRSISVL